MQIRVTSWGNEMKNESDGCVMAAPCINQVHPLTLSFVKDSPMVQSKDCLIVEGEL